MKYITVNLPVRDLDRAVVFYQDMGFERKPEYSDESSVLLAWSEAVYVMLHSHDAWRSFTSRPVPSVDSSEVMLALSCDSREAVDAMVERAGTKGGVADINPVQNSDFMYCRDWSDLDGHVWEAVWVKL